MRQKIVPYKSALSPLGRLRLKFRICLWGFHQNMWPHLTEVADG